MIQMLFFSLKSDSRAFEINHLYLRRLSVIGSIKNGELFLGKTNYHASRSWPTNMWTQFFFIFNNQINADGSENMRISCTRGSMTSTLQLVQFLRLFLDHRGLCDLAECPLLFHRNVKTLKFLITIFFNLISPNFPSALKFPATLNT